MAKRKVARRESRAPTAKGPAPQGHVPRSGNLRNAGRQWLRGLILLGIGALAGWLLNYPFERADHRSKRGVPDNPHTPTLRQTVSDRTALRDARDLEDVDHRSFPYSDATFARLDAVRKQKKAALLRLFADVEHAAQQVVRDEAMLTCFHRMHELYGTAGGTEVHMPERLDEAVNEYRRAMNYHYALHYSRFYDVLFVSPDKYVFYSFRLEDDYHTYLEADSNLAQGLDACLIGGPHTVLIDYHLYEPSERTSAFFGLPVMRNDEHIGWMVVQYAINVLDSLLVDHSELGSTGEVYLLNRQRRMLTDSRFSGERTHLKFTVDALDATALESDAPGHGLMRDYRGVPVFASYERLAALGREWVLVAQIDESEVITDYYRDHEAECRALLVGQLAREDVRQRCCGSPCGAPRRVGMDDFAKTADERPLETRGVSTCTAVAVTCPGRFGYLAHISPYDKIYGSTQLTNVLKQVITRIRQYDIYQSEVSKLQVVVVATHTESLPGILAKLPRYGITLDQIRFLHKPEARYADVFVGPRGDGVTVEWVGKSDASQHHAQWAADVPDLAQLLRRCYRQGARSAESATAGEPPRVRPDAG